MWFQRFFQALGGSHNTPLYLYNTLSKQKDIFELPQGVHRVRMYNCGPTVYNRQHIGNLSMFVFTDILRRALEVNGFHVKQVINITDVGHLSSDADSGEDKMTLGLKREGMELTLENMRALADKYANIFVADLESLNIDTSRVQFPRASDHVPAQIAMIKTLEEKGYAYKTKDGLYFDTRRFSSYGALGGIDLSGLKEGARVATVEGKRHATDFALWKLNADLGWESPWGRGFPGWHIECSAMIRVCLGERIDIHTGGIEHIPIHHNNEIAQSESATGKRPLSRFWLHRAHIQIEGGKIAKSHGNVVYLSDITKRGFHPISLRYLFLGAHYRTPSNFSWEALQAAQNTLEKLISIADRASREAFSPAPKGWLRSFRERINDDLDTPGALAVMWEMIKDPQLAPGQLFAGLSEMDKVLGLQMFEPDEKFRSLMQREVSIDELSADVQKMIKERDLAREQKNWVRADELRESIEKSGFSVEDNDGGTRITTR